MPRKVCGALVRYSDAGPYYLTDTFEYRTLTTDRPIFIALSPSAIRVSIDASLAACTSVPVPEGDYERAWKEDLLCLDDLLRGAISAAGIDTLPAARTVAHVVYHVPQSRVETARASQSVERTLSAFRASLPDQGANWSCASALLRAQSHAPLAGRSQDSMLLIAGEADNNLEAVSQWLARCGFAPGVCIPTRAALAQQSAHNIDPAAAVIRVVMGEHTTAFCAWERGQAQCVAFVESGFRDLTLAVHRALRSLAHSTPSTITDAEALLIARGIPEPDATWHEQLKLRGSDALGFLQVIVQRHCLELQQTLRLAFASKSPADVRVELLGLAASVPGLGAALRTPLGFAGSEQAGPPAADVFAPEPHQPNIVRISAASAARALDPVMMLQTTRASAGDLATLVALGINAPWLVPASTRIAESHRLLTRGVRWGLAAAAVTLGALGTLHALMRSRSEARWTLVSADLDTAAKLAQERDRAMTAAKASGAAREAAASTLGPRTPWTAALGAISRAVEPNVQITSITLEPVAKATHASIIIRGEAQNPLNIGRSPVKGAQSNAQDAVAVLAQRLADAPSLSEVRTLASTVDPARPRVRRFVVQCRARELPAILARASTQPPEAPQ